MSIESNLKKGTVEILLLAVLMEEDMYGYQICQELALRSNGLFTLQEGSTYPILYRLSEKGLISTRKELVGKRRTRVYYHMEPAGVTYMNELWDEYFSIHNGLTKILDSIEGLQYHER